ncbi:hypothetical protein ACFL2Q_07345 [Thermodesulfobacteriota bacterium]
MDFTISDIVGYYEHNLRKAADPLRLSFTCPECGNTELEEACTYTVPFGYIVSQYENARTGDLAWDHDSIDFDTHELSFRCLKGEYEIVDASGHPIHDMDQLAAWLLQNCKQPDDGLLKRGRWTEEEISFSAARFLLQKAGYELTFDDDEGGWRLERWEHPDGEYGLMALHGKGLYMTNDVNDDGWIGILSLLSISPDWSYMEDVLELVVCDSDENIIEGDTVQPGKAPETEEAWQEVVEDWLSDPRTRKEPGTTLALLDRRTDENIFTFTFE